MKRDAHPGVEIDLIIPKPTERIKRALPPDLTYGLGAAIKAVRQARQMTQEELALKTGMDRVTLVHLEGGRHRLPVSTLYSIAEALGMKLSIKLEPKK
jgi:DNA-binding XRE family transcriptional regulator